MTSPDVLKTFDTSGSARLIAAVKKIGRVE